MFGQAGFGALKKFLEKNMVMVMTFQCSSKCILLYLVEAENLSYVVCLCCHQLIVSACMAYGKVCCDQLVMSATGRGVESGGTAVCLPFLDPDMFFPSNTGVPGKKKVSRRRHNMSDSIILTHQVRTSTQQTSQNRHDTETHCWKKFPFLLWTYWNRMPSV